jgi:hypothetical protein
MKKNVLYFIGILISFNVFSQNTIKAVTSVSASSIDDPLDVWDVNKFVWSHTHLIGKKGVKPPLNFEALQNWISLSEYLSFCDNGAFIAYMTRRGPKFSERFDSIVIQSTENSWRLAFANAYPGFFSADNKLYVFKVRSELYILSNGTSQIEKISDVSYWKKTPTQSAIWIAYHLKDNTLVLRNLLTRSEKKFQNVSSFDFDKSGKWLYFKLKNTGKLIVYNLDLGEHKQFDGVDDFFFHEGGEALLTRFVEKTGDKILTSLYFNNLLNGISHVIWSTVDSNVALDSYSFDKSGKKVIFMVANRCKTDLAKSLFPFGNSIWFWQEGMETGELRISNESSGIPSNKCIAGAFSFIEDNNNCLQFRLQPKTDPLLEIKSYKVQLDVSSYKDTLLQSEQMERLKQPAEYLAVYNIQTRLVLQLEDEVFRLKCLKKDFAVIAKSGRLINGDRFWEKNYNIDSNWLISLRDGTRRQLPATEVADLYTFSPNGKFIIYNNSRQKGHYFSIELATGRLINITKELPSWQLGMDGRLMAKPSYPKYAAGIAEWLDGDSIALVYDPNDIWKLDLTGRTAPLNITNGYGFKNKLSFSLFNTSQPQSYNREGVSSFIGKDSLILRAFDDRNKFNGFYLKRLADSGDPEKLIMGPYMFSAPLFVDGLDLGMIPLKSNMKNVWIVKRQTATEAPNYFLTKDFKSYKQLTDIRPHEHYNWLTTELHNFRQLDGTLGNGVLYKPENFDSTKKYPVIISFYGHLSDRPFQYPQPGYIYKPSIFDDPTWMVSHEYLVFLPDIYFSTDQWGNGVVNSLEGAVKYLSRLAYVDKKCIGAAGHSNSGRFAYYLFTHSKSFSAMAIGSGGGGIDIVNLALSEGEWLQWGESEAYGAGLGNLWENKATWIDHSGVLQADNANCPLLSVYNKKDQNDPTLKNYGMEMFVALRRLEKKAWWLQYDRGEHILGVTWDQRDFTIRFTQFFDHYLKGAPAPEWMTKGIPARYKGIESRFELDFDGTCGLNCVSCKKLSRFKSVFSK